MDTTDSVQNRYIVLRTNTCRVAVCDEQSRIVAQRAVDARGIASSLRIATGLHVASTHGDHRAISNQSLYTLRTDTPNAPLKRR